MTLANMVVITIVRLEENNLSVPEGDVSDGFRVDKFPYYLADDLIFPLKTWQMTPYPGNLTKSF